LCLTPLKTSEPFLLYVDKNTGFANIVETLHDAKKNYGEVVDRYFLANYVRLHEGYEWESIQSTVDQSMLFSGRKVGQELQDFMKRPAAPYKVYGKDEKVTIKINSISFLDSMAQVRYTKTILAANGGTYNATTGEITPTPQASNWIATIGYEYQNPPTAEQARLVNPLGFVVQSYRTDPDSSK
jgi:type IV secretion system protein VirB8